MSGYRLSHRAKTRLEDIFAYTNERFGRAQAEHYRDSLLNRLASLAENKPPYGRACSILAGDDAPEGLFYVKQGGHFIVFIKGENEILIVDFIHQMRDLPMLIASLTADKA